MSDYENDVRLAPGVRHVVCLAKAIARGLNHEYVGTEHLLLALVKDIPRTPNHVARLAFERLNIDPRKIRLEVEKLVQGGTETVDPEQPIPLTPRAKSVLDLAIREANLQRAGKAVPELSDDHYRGTLYVDSGHLLIGLLVEVEGIAAVVLRSLGMTLDSVRVGLGAYHKDAVVTTEADLQAARSRADEANKVKWKGMFASADWSILPPQTEQPLLIETKLEELKDELRQVQAEVAAWGKAVTDVSQMVMEVVSARIIARDKDVASGQQQIEKLIALAESLTALLQGQMPKISPPAFLTGPTVGGGFQVCAGSAPPTDHKATE